MNRRHFMMASVLSSMATSSVPSLLASSKAIGFQRPKVRFGICADLHHDFIADAPRRLSAFTDEMIRQQPDFIIQMGDFCFPESRNRPLMDIWNRFSGRKYHVLGNHDIEMAARRSRRSNSGNPKANTIPSIRMATTW